jgi:hypothetical protein
MTERPLLIVDIDGVIADVTHRQHHLAGPRRDWDAFFGAAGHDPVLEAGADAVRQADADGNRIVYLTGRPERLRRVTESWLAQHELPVALDCLIMRPHRDWRPAPDFKLQVVLDLAQSHTVVNLWDDDAAVVDAVQAAGFPATVPEWTQPRNAGLIEAQDRLGRT